VFLFKNYNIIKRRIKLVTFSKKYIILFTKNKDIKVKLVNLKKNDIKVKFCLKLVRFSKEDLIVKLVYFQIIEVRFKISNLKFAKKQY
jgi:hypothetical protein